MDRRANINASCQTENDGYLLGANANGTRNVTIDKLAQSIKCERMQSDSLTPP